MLIIWPEAWKMKQTLKAAKSSGVKNEPKKHVKNEPTMLIMLIMLKLNGTQFHRILVCGGADDKYAVSQNNLSQIAGRIIWWIHIFSAITSQSVRRC